MKSNSLIAIAAMFRVHSWLTTPMLEFAGGLRAQSARQLVKSLRQLPDLVFQLRDPRLKRITHAQRSRSFTA